MIKDQQPQSIISVQDAKDHPAENSIAGSGGIQERCKFLVETTNLLVHELKTL